MVILAVHLNEINLQIQEIRTHIIHSQPHLKPHLNMNISNENSNQMMKLVEM